MKTTIIIIVLTALFVTFLLWVARDISRLARQDKDENETHKDFINGTEREEGGNAASN